MDTQHKIGKFGTVFARRVALSPSDRDLGSDVSRVLAGLHLDTRQPGPQYDEYPGLTVNGIEYHLSVHALRERYSGGSERVWLRYWQLRRAGSGADATVKAQAAVRPLLEALAAQLFADPLWMAETDVELAEEAYSKAQEGVEKAEADLFRARDGAVVAAAALRRAKENWERTRKPLP